MAFFSKYGVLLRQTASKQLLNSEPCATKPSIFQAVRCLSSLASSKLFVGGLSYATDDFQLREAFGKYGQVVEARVIVDRETGRSRGFGFVTFTSSEEASSAIQGMDGQPLHGRNVRVNYATEKTRGGFGGGGYRSNYGGAGGGFGDNFGNNFGGGGGGNYGPGGGNYGNLGGVGGGNYGPPSGSNYGGDNYGHGGTSYSGNANYAAGGQYAGGSTYDRIAGGGGVTANFEGSSTGSDFEGSPDSGFGSGDQMSTNVTDGADVYADEHEKSDILDGNYRDDDDGDFAKRA